MLTRWKLKNSSRGFLIARNTFFYPRIKLFLTWWKLKKYLIKYLHQVKLHKIELLRLPQTTQIKNIVLENHYEIVRATPSKIKLHIERKQSEQNLGLFFTISATLSTTPSRSCTLVLKFTWSHAFWCSRVLTNSSHTLFSSSLHSTTSIKTSKCFHSFLHAPKHFSNK